MHTLTLFYAKTGVFLGVNSSHLLKNIVKR